MWILYADADAMPSRWSKTYTRTSTKQKRRRTISTYARKGIPENWKKSICIKKRRVRQNFNGILLNADNDYGDNLFEACLMRWNLVSQPRSGEEEERKEKKQTNNVNLC